jgi:hypothetical protein
VVRVPPVVRQGASGGTQKVFVFDINKSKLTISIALGSIKRYLVIF